MGYLDTLKPHQLNGFEAFKRWYHSESPEAVLVGRGGTGKTYSVGRYVLELGIDPMQVLAVAPTNTAAKRLSTDMATAGFRCPSSTVHKALWLVPEPQEWKDDDDARMREITVRVEKAKNEGVENPIEFRADQVALGYLLRKLDAFRKGKLIFSPKEPIVIEQEDGTEVEYPKQYQLYVVDECSMISQEIYELMAMSWWHGKILFLGDPKQMLPVGEGLSKCFEAPWIAEFVKSERAKGNLAKIHEAVARVNNHNSAAEILKGLPHWEEFGVKNPWDIPKDEAVIISRTESRSLMEHWVNTRPFDGLAYRLVAYKNETVDQVNNACLMMAGFKCPQSGWSMVAKSPVNRSGPDDATGKWESIRILQTSEMFTLDGVKSVAKAQIPGFGHFTVFKLAYRGGGDDAFLSANDKLNLIYPENSFLGEWKPDSQFVLKWTNDDVYTAGAKFWEAIVSAIYCKGTPPQPSANSNIEILFDYLNADSWCNFVGCPGKTTYKPPKSGKLDFDFLLAGASKKEIKKFNQEVFDHEGRPIFSQFRKRVYRLHRWLQDQVIDPVSMVSCSTVYKAQGQTILDVAIPLEEILSSARFGANAGENTLRALYTATSRSSERLFVIV